MSNEYFEFNGSYYYVNMNKFMEFVSSSTSDERDTNTTITQVFAETSDVDDDFEEEDTSPYKDKSIGNDFRAVSKEITESKSSYNAVFNNVRYDLARIFLNTLLTPLFSQNGEPCKFENEQDLLLGHKIAFNTLLHHGIIEEIK
jgi:hypothetical protein